MEKNVAFIALFAGLIAALGLIPSITMMYGVPITAQTLGVMLAGTILGSKRGALAVMLFLALVIIGLPLLSGGRGGIGVLYSPSAGFLIGWPIGAFVTGLIVENWKSEPFVLVSGIASAIGCIFILYIFGIIGMAIILEIPLPKAGVIALVYIPGDILKSVIAGILTSALFQARPSSILSRQ